MATFCYEHPKTGQIVEQFFRCGMAPAKITLPDGTVCLRCMAAEIRGQGARVDKPSFSRALAVHPTQAKEYAEFCTKHGVPTRYDEMGHPHYTGKKHRKKHAELFGATDFDGGYGDPHSG